MLTAGLESIATARHLGFTAQIDSTLCTHTMCMENLIFTVQILEALDSKHMCSV